MHRQVTHLNSAVPGTPIAGGSTNTFGLTLTLKTQEGQGQQVHGTLLHTVQQVQGTLLHTVQQVQGTLLHTVQQMHGQAVQSGHVALTPVRLIVKVSLPIVISTLSISSPAIVVCWRLISVASTKPLTVTTVSTYTK